MVLDRGVQSVQERTPLKLWFDEEESVFTLTADEETKIVTEGEFGAEEYNIKCSKLDLIDVYKRQGILEQIEQCIQNRQLNEHRQAAADHAYAVFLLKFLHFKSHALL